MATFDKNWVIERYGSLEKFAREDGCYKIYEVESGSLISIRSPRDEQAMLGSSSCTNPRLVWKSR